MNHHLHPLDWSLSELGQLPLVLIIRLVSLCTKPSRYTLVVLGHLETTYRP